MKSNVQHLFQDFTFKNGVHVRNRLTMAPMTTFSADSNDYVSQEELDYYKERANGIGTIITACAYISKNGTHNPYLAWQIEKYRTFLSA